jgi:hypothetical protein
LICSIKSIRTEYGTQLATLIRDRADWKYISQTIDIKLTMGREITKRKLLKPKKQQTSCRLSSIRGKRLGLRASTNLRRRREFDLVKLLGKRSFSVVELRKLTLTHLDKMVQSIKSWIHQDDYAAR